MSKEGKEEDRKGANSLAFKDQRDFQEGTKFISIDLLQKKCVEYGAAMEGKKEGADFDGGGKRPEAVVTPSAPGRRKR